MHHYYVYRRTVGRISRPGSNTYNKYDTRAPRKIQRASLYSWIPNNTDVALLESLSVVSCNNSDETLSRRLRDPSACSEILWSVLKISCRSRFSLPLRIPQLLLVLVISMPLFLLFLRNVVLVRWSMGMFLPRRRRTWIIYILCIGNFLGSMRWLGSRWVRLVLPV